MATLYVKSDIYDKDGKLLLAAGRELTENLLIRLEKMNIGLNENTTENVNENANVNKYIPDIKSNINQLRRNLHISNDDIYSSSSEIVIDIVFNSKNKPWWLYVNTLSSYVDWLYTHSINVSIISTMIAEALGLTKEREDIALGAFLHDIGKLMIPKSIIQKNGTLTEDEIYYIRQHCDLGYSMVTGFNLNHICLDIIQEHHERLDGSGYPLGLKETQLPIHSKIVIIADIFDAITSYRPFRPARNIEAAVNELRKNASRYPQDIIDIFYSLIK